MFDGFLLPVSLYFLVFPVLFKYNFLSFRFGGYLAAIAACLTVSLLLHGLNMHIRALSQQLRVLNSDLKDFCSGETDKVDFMIWLRFSLMQIVGWSDPCEVYYQSFIHPLLQVLLLLTNSVEFFNFFLLIQLTPFEILIDFFTKVMTVPLRRVLLDYSLVGYVLYPLVLLTLLCILWLILRSRCVLLCFSLLFFYYVSFLN